jgi:hypothetical protein
MEPNGTGMIPPGLTHATASQKMNKKTCCQTFGFSLIMSANAPFWVRVNRIYPEMHIKIEQN